MATIEEQLAAAEQKVARLKEKQRKLETRKKIIVGATLMKENTEENLKGWLNERLTKKEDRDLFGLPEKNSPDPHPNQNPQPDPHHQQEKEKDYRNTEDPF